MIQRLVDPERIQLGQMAFDALVDESAVRCTAGQYRRWLDDLTLFSMSNVAVVAGLAESGRPDLSAELNWATINTWHGNYREFIRPSGGRLWSARLRRRIALHWRYR